LKASSPQSPFASAALPSAWGFLEATCFFIVPDVLTSRLALKSLRQGLSACGYAVGGALAGGGLLYFTGLDPSLQSMLSRAMDYIPGIDHALIVQAAADLRDQRLAALFTGVLAGVPYKLYAVQASEAGFGAVAFLLVSAVARLSRFLAVTTLTWVVGAKLLPHAAHVTKTRIHALCWIVFYCIYFWRMGV
jgi:membrane protein YqaA with SNARE-associated domain